MVACIAAAALLALAPVYAVYGGVNPVCSVVPHAHFVWTGASGQELAAWHPATDPASGCAFPHEHGSDPSKFIGAKRAGTLAFGALAQKMGMAEPHEGFKVYVVNNDGHGKAWMVVLHQGTAGPKRATQPHHSLDLWMVRRRDRALLAEVHVIADFGRAVEDCEGLIPPPATRVLPSLAPGCSHDYEAWTTQLSVGGRLRAPGITFGVDNPTTVIDDAAPGRLAFNAPDVCGPGDPAGETSTCKGDRRWIQHPRWVLDNRGPAVFYTDAYGAGYSTRPFPGSVRQYVRRGMRIDERRVWGGPAAEFRVANPAGGGVFRSGLKTPSRGFDTTGAIHWPN